MHFIKAAVILTLITVLSSAGLAFGQDNKPAGQKRTSKAAGSKRRPSERRPPSSQRTQPSPVTLVSSHSPEYLSGEANVIVKGNENPIIRLGLARSGVTLVEFPASDRFFALHPGDSDMVTIDESPTKQNDHFFIFRAGSNFVPPFPPRMSSGPSASIIAQMRSGLVVTFLIYPVRELSQMAHRIVVLYDRAEVVASRRAAGLAVNLAERQEQQPQRSIRIAAEPDSTTTISEPGSTDDNRANARPRTVGPGQTTPAPGANNSPITPGRLTKPNTNPGSSTDLESEARKLLKLTITSSKLKRWSRPVHGLKLATSSPKELNQGQAIVVVAVSNILPEPLRLVPGQPELSVETRDEKGKTLLVERITPLHVESSALDNSVPAGSTLYYAIVYQRPILGVRQQLRASVAQINAADDPAVTDLTMSSR
jgi:hypothetical protein